MRKVSQDEIIGVWLKREFEGNCETIRQHLTFLTKEEMETIVSSNNYQDDEENRMRFLALNSFRHNVLSSSLNARWNEKTLDLSDFMELRVLKGLGWNILSRFSGKISAVADLIFNEPERCNSVFLHKASANLFFGILGFHPLIRKCKEIIKAILHIEKKGNFNTDLILLQSNDSGLTTILEGNKTAVALYIKYCLKEESSYKPFRVFIGHQESKSRWQR